MTPSDICNLTLKYIDTLNISTSFFKSPEEKDSPEGQLIEKRFIEMRRTLIDAQEYSLKWIDSIANLAIRYRVGNCVEHSCIAIQYILSLEEDISVELFSIPGRDHFFVVLNRNNTDENNPINWNKSCMILDPLHRISFSVDGVDYPESSVDKGVRRSLQSEYPMGALARCRLETVVTSADYELQNGLNSHIDDEYWPDDSSSDHEETPSSGFTR